MSDLEAILVAVLHEPHRDDLRLAYADALDDAGEADRAEFIRVSCEWAKPRTAADRKEVSVRFGHRCPVCDGPGVWRSGVHFDHEKRCVAVGCGYTWQPESAERMPAGFMRLHRLNLRILSLFAAGGGAWFGRNACLTPPTAREQRSGGEWRIVRRGFVAEVRCTLAAFVGGPCVVPAGRSGRCVGGTFQDVTGTSGKCPYCSGTGRTPGLAAELFGRQPVTEVTLTDREPAFWPSRAVTGWHRANGRDPLAAGLPAELFDRLPPSRWESSAYEVRRDEIRLYGPPAASLDALSAACVSLGRSVASGHTHAAPCKGCEGNGGRTNPYCDGNSWDHCPNCDGSGTLTVPGLPPLPEVQHGR